VDEDTEVIRCDEALKWSDDKQMYFLGDAEKTKALQEAMKNTEVGDMRAGVQLPPGEDLSLWLANYFLYFFKRTSAVWETFRPCCTRESSPVMCTTAEVEFLWADGETVECPMKLSAPEYISRDLAWIERELDELALIPEPFDGHFSTKLIMVKRVMAKRLFRVYAHLFTMHPDMVSDNAQLAFKHFMLLSSEFALVEGQLLRPMQEFIDKHCLSQNKRVRSVSEGV